MTTEPNVEAAAEPHEFESFDDKCCVPVGLGLLPCGQPKDATIHVTFLTVEEKLVAMQYDSEYQFRARRILRESELSVGIPLAANSVPNDLAIRIAIALAERDSIAKRELSRREAAWQGVVDAAAKIVDAFEARCEAADDWCGGSMCPRCGDDANLIKVTRAALAVKGGE